MDEGLGEHGGTAGRGSHDRWIRLRVGETNKQWAPAWPDTDTEAKKPMQKRAAARVQTHKQAGAADPNADADASEFCRVVRVRS